MPERVWLRNFLRFGLAVWPVALLAGAAASVAAATALAGEQAIRIGVLSDMNGSGSTTGGAGSVTAAKLAIEDVGGAINGKPIDLISGDEQGKPEIAASIAREWFDKEAVDVIADLPGSNIALAVQVLGREKHRIILNTGGLTTDLTRGQCSPWSIQWADDTSALSQGTVRALLAQGLRKWFFVTADFAFGHALQRDATKVLQDNGGEVVGSVQHAMETDDFSTYLVAAQSSRAQVVAFANSAVNTINSIKQAAEFGLGKSKSLAALLVYISDVNSLGLPAAQGLYVTSGLYWDESDATRAFARRFFAIHNKMPTREQANIYAGLLNYFRAVKETGSDAPDTVMAWLHTHTLDYFGRPVTLRADGRVLYDLTLYQVKTPEESKYSWDYYKKVADVPAQQAFLPMDSTLCHSLSTQ